MPLEDFTPSTIPELWFVLDKRLTRIEDAQVFHAAVHEEIQKDLDDHEQRIRAGLSFTAVVTGIASFVAILSLIKSFLP